MHWCALCSRTQSFEASLLNIGSHQFGSQTPNAPLPVLVIASSLAVKMLDDGYVSMSKKFVSGVAEYQKEWPGTVHVIMEPTATEGNNLDYQRMKIADLPFQLSIKQFSDPGVKEIIREASIVSMMLYHKQFHLAKICRDLAVPCVYVSEYTFKTRRQIISSEGHSLPMRLAKYVLEGLREHKARQAVRNATGLQSNGVPTFGKYHNINRNPMLFFDTRTSRDMLATQVHIDLRNTVLKETGVLRLGFSGRLIKMKGVDHLISVAKSLSEMGVKFTLSICGDGGLKPEMEHEVTANGLTDKVRFEGNLAFEDELVPFIRDNIDVFLCCHRQGDPSCTYLETMSCGVPIMGYANEAYVGVYTASRAGWIIPMNEPEMMAEQLSKLTPTEIKIESSKSLEFARGHTVEEEFSRRMAHIRMLSVED